MDRPANVIAANIAAWDMADIKVLRDLIAELSESCEDTQEFIDMTSLPTAPIPADINTAFPVWAVDLNNIALVGDNAQGIMPLAQVRAAQ
jgi:hypothetical protein